MSDILIDRPELASLGVYEFGWSDSDSAGASARRGISPEVVSDIRGKGLLVGVQVIPNNREIMALARDHGLLIAGGGDNCVRLLPPLNLTLEEAREAIEKLEHTFEAARVKLAA